MTIKCLCWALTWCVQRQMSVAIKGEDREEVTKGAAQPLKVTFMGVSFGKDCSENARGKGGGRQRGGGKRETKKAKDEVFFLL